MMTTADRVRELASLPAGWDTYGSVPPTLAAVNAALKIAEEIDRRGAEPPVVSSVAGGVLFEWQACEIECHPNGEVTSSSKGEQ